MEFSENEKLVADLRTHYGELTDDAIASRKKALEAQHKANAIAEFCRKVGIDLHG